MLRFLKSLFGGSGMAARQARNPPEAFARWFLSTDLYALSVAEVDPIKFDEIEGDALIAQLEQALQQADQAENVTLFLMHTGNQTALPVFDRDAAVTEFLKTFAKRTQKVIPFTRLTLKGAALVPQLGQVDDVIFNPVSNDAFILSEEQVAAIIANQSGE